MQSSRLVNEHQPYVRTNHWQMDYYLLFSFQIIYNFVVYLFIQYFSGFVSICARVYNTTHYIMHITFAQYTSVWASTVSYSWYVQQAFFSYSFNYTFDHFHLTSCRSNTACQRLSFNQMFGVCRNVFGRRHYYIRDGWQTGQIKKFVPLSEIYFANADCLLLHTHAQNRILVYLCSHLIHIRHVRDSFVWFCYYIAIRCNNVNVETEAQCLCFPSPFVNSIYFYFFFPVHFLLYLLPHGISGKINSDVNLKLNSKNVKTF